MARIGLSTHLIAATLLCFCQSLTAQNETDSTWSYSLAGFYYFVPEDENSISFIGYADYKKIHMEARYNYEDRNTASIFGGWRFETGKKLKFSATPMLGLIVGNTDGIAPGLELELSYRRFSYYSETEYVMDFSGNENNFFYVWGELVFKPIEPLEIGMSYQKTRLYKSDFDVQRGIVAKYSFWKLTAGLYYFNPFSDSELFVFSMSVDF